MLGDPAAFPSRRSSTSSRRSSALGVDNALIEIDGAGSAGDGRQRRRVRRCDRAGRHRHADRAAALHQGAEPVRVELGSAFAEFRPYDGRRFEIAIDYDCAVIGRQAIRLDLTPKSFRRDIARARTFGYMRDVERLWAAGFALGSSLENSVVIGDGGVVNPEGLRYRGRVRAPQGARCDRRPCARGCADPRPLPVLQGRPQAEPDGAFGAARGQERVDASSPAERAETRPEGRAELPAGMPVPASRRKSSAPPLPKERGDRGARPQPGHHSVQNGFETVAASAINGNRSALDGAWVRWIYRVSLRLNGRRAAAVLLAPALAFGARRLPQTSRRRMSSSIRPTFSTIRRSRIWRPATRATRPRNSRTIDKEHPYSEYARRSTLMSAFLNFRRGKYQDAINDAQRYVTLFPAHPDAAYAQYLIGESYFRQIPDVTRDQDSGAEGHGRDGRGDPQVSGFRIRQRRAEQDRVAHRPDRRQGDADRPLLSGAEGISRRRQPLQDGRARSTRRRATSRRRCTG